MTYTFLWRRENDCSHAMSTRRFFKNNVVDIIQPDIIHAGGIMELKKIAAMADAHYVMVAPHCSNGPACTAASVHFDFCTTNVKIQECFDDFAPDFVREAVPGFPRVKDGYFSPPDAPGLGIDLNLDVIKEHPYRFGPLQPIRRRLATPRILSALPAGGYI